MRYGIDFGTTNSTIAKWFGTEARILKDFDDRETTPSAVYRLSTGVFEVGDKALEMLVNDPVNGHVDFKRKLGTNEPFPFPARGAAVPQTELSAAQLATEVFRELRRVAELHYPEEPVRQAVITVPAEANFAQVAATIEAAKAAGIVHCQTVPEPFAASYAYSRRTTLQDGIWLVYDLGGGTFDTVLLRMEGGSPIAAGDPGGSGEIRFLGHEGKQFLGGRRIDADIVDRFFVPVLQRQYNLPNFSRDNPEWSVAFRWLDRTAEKYKHRLSTRAQDQINESAAPFRDRNNNYPDLTTTLTQAQLEEISGPYVSQTIECCKKMLDDARRRGAISDDPNPNAIRGVLLVGGPTKMPWLRRQLKAELGIKIYHTVDPMTAVAQGAAIVASLRPWHLLDDLDQTKFVVRMSPEIGSSPTPRVEVTITPPKGREVELDGATLELVTKDVEIGWTSTRLPVPATGVVEVPKLAAEERVTHVFSVLLSHPQHGLLPTDPAELSYTRGTEPPLFLFHNVGVGVRGNLISWLLRRNDPLPAANQGTYPTTKALARNGAEPFRLFFYEGEHPKADRNLQVGTIEILPRDVRQDLREGTEILIRLEVDPSRQVTVTAEHKPTGQKWNNVLQLGPMTVPSVGELRERVVEIRKSINWLGERLDFIAGQPETSAEAVTLRRMFEAAQIRRLPEGGWVSRRLEQVELALRGAATDVGSRQIADRESRELQAQLDQIDAATELPRLIADNYSLIRLLRDGYGDRIDKYGHRQQFKQTCDGASEAMKNRDARALLDRRNELWELEGQVLTPDEHKRHFGEGNPDIGVGGKGDWHVDRPW